MVDRKTTIQAYSERGESVGRKKEKYRHISSHRIKWVIKNRGLTQVKLADDLFINKDNLNLQIRRESMEINLLDSIARKLNVAVEYLTGEINASSPKDFYMYSSNPQIDDEGYCVPGYEETEIRREFSTVEDAFLKIGSDLLELYKILVAGHYIDNEETTIKALSLSECDYIFDQLGIIKKLPFILKSIEKERG